MQNVKSRIHGPVGALILLATLSNQLTTVHAQGSLTPPGPPAPTMKSLAQIEPRTAITNSTLVTISQPGSYYLTTNITVASGDGIIISTNNVTLDLEGFTISSTKASAGGTGILLSGGRTNIVILNGIISGGVTNGAGVYAGPGFANGIFYSGTSVTNYNVRVSGIVVSGCLNNGINLSLSTVGTGNSTTVESCNVQTVGGLGIQAGTVLRSTANICGSVAITANNASDCFGYCAGTGAGVSVFQIANNCYGYATGAGIGVSATTANSCWGFCADNGTGFAAGVTAATVNNCYGYSTGSGYGISVTTAINCYGENDGNGIGLFSEVANDCWGYSTVNGNGLQVDYVAIGCLGKSYLGTGLVAYIANSCVGISSSGTAESVTDKFNML